jgi:hypothetical protein
VTAIPEPTQGCVTHRFARETKKKTIGKVAKYLTNHTEMLRYDHYMQQGYPIAAGVIEGACRHLTADRFEITGDRWSLRTAEGILKLRAIRSSGDWELYQTFHRKQELKRNHLQRFHESEMKPMVWAKRVVPKEPHLSLFPPCELCAFVVRVGFPAREAGGAG